MPKSKRSKVVSLAKTVKKSKDRKTDLVTEIREAADIYSHIYVFSVNNMRNNRLKDLRSNWVNSRFYLGKNKLMVMALGKGSSDEYKDGLSQVSKQIVGQSGLFFTNSGPEEVQKFFEEYTYPDYARSGFKATEDFVLQEGPLTTMPFSMEPQLRQLGLQTRLREGKIYLEKETTVCKEGDVLTPEQCRLLTLFEVQMAVFQVNVHCHWSAGQFDLYSDNTQVRADGDDEAEDDGDEKEEDGDDME